MLRNLLTDCNPSKSVQTLPFVNGNATMNAELELKHARIQKFVGFNAGT